MGRLQVKYMSNVWEEGELYVGKIGAGTAEDWGLIGSRICRLFNYRFKYMLSHAVQIAFFQQSSKSISQTCAYFADTYYSRLLVQL